VCATKLDQSACQCRALKNTSFVLTPSCKTTGLLCVWSCCDARHIDGNPHFTTEEDFPSKLCLCITILATLGAVATTKTARNLKLEVLPHPPCSPNLTQCDLHTFVSRKGITWSRVWQCEERNGAFVDSVTTLPSSLMGSGSLWLVTKGVWHCRKTLLKNNRAVMYIHCLCGQQK
jgi:hypothetical protein